MMLPSNPPQLFLYLSILLSTTSIVIGTNSFIYAACFPSQYPSNTPFQSNLQSLLTSLASSATSSSYNSFAFGNSSSAPPGSAAYGLYQCRNDLSALECSSCVQSAVGQLGLVCPEGHAAALQLGGCLVRYGNDDFLGKLDTSVAYKRCSSKVSGGDGGEFVRRRDDVLDDLGSGEGFKVSGSGKVQGYAQCMGDLSSGDCAACIAQAVEQLKSMCGASLAADLFLEQCYARFWASGYYPRAAAASGLLPCAGGGAVLSQNLRCGVRNERIRCGLEFWGVPGELYSKISMYSPDYTDDDIGRTVAIIVGILAGVALLVVFISFMKRAS